MFIFIRDSNGISVNVIKFSHRDMSTIYRNTVGNMTSLESTTPIEGIDDRILEIYFDDSREVDVLIRLLEDYRDRVNDASDWRHTNGNS